jgi:hypothetical protein
MEEKRCWEELETNVQPARNAPCRNVAGIASPIMMQYGAPREPRRV